MDILRTSEVNGPVVQLGLARKAAVPELAERLRAEPLGDAGAGRVAPPSTSRRRSEPRSPRSPISSWPGLSTARSAAPKPCLPVTSTTRSAAACDWGVGDAAGESQRGEEGGLARALVVLAASDWIGIVQPARVVHVELGGDALAETVVTAASDVADPDLAMLALSSGRDRAAPSASSRARRPSRLAGRCRSAVL